MTVILSCSDDSVRIRSDRKISADLDSIMARGTLLAVTDLNSTSYFVYKGEPMGFHFDLLEAFTAHLGVDLIILTENRIDKAFEMLQSGEADLLAMNLTINSSRKKDISFSEPIIRTRQVLIQKKPEGWRSMKNSVVEKKLLRNQTELAGKTIYVQAGSSHSERLYSLADEIGEKISVVEAPFESEVLIQLVADGEIEYAVCDENVAIVNATYYPDIDVSTPVSFEQNLAWGIRKTHSEQLSEELNNWIRDFKNTKKFALIYAKYFRNSNSSSIIKSDYFSLVTGRVSPWDDLIKTFSDTINWDWRLLASLIYQESRFLPDVRSRAGAYGLMQIMPETAKNFGIDVTTSPLNNLKAGAMYIKWLNGIFEPLISDENERMKFILASYNAGPGHILDAMRLAEKNGMDPYKWQGSVALWLTKKSDPQYYNDDVVSSGYFKGKESIAFVDQIIKRYEHYKNVID
jgi:membrane-bound lytic murein transglycosylase F